MKAAEAKPGLINFLLCTAEFSTSVVVDKKETEQNKFGLCEHPLPIDLIFRPRRSPRSPPRPQQPRALRNGPCCSVADNSTEEEVANR